MNILITGDSFSADWSKKYPGRIGWPNMLSRHFTVTNLSQAGCSEYRIYKQLASVNLNDYDYIVISHTSPYRIYTDYNPNRCNDTLHHHCDLIYSDVKELSTINKEYYAVSDYFEKFFSLEYADYMYLLIRQDIVRLTEGSRVIHISHMETQVPVDIDFSTEYQSNSGLINHYNNTGNQNIFARLLQQIQS